jgi:hypothetical protein
MDWARSPESPSPRQSLQKSPSPHHVPRHEAGRQVQAKESNHHCHTTLRSAVQCSVHGDSVAEQRTKDNWFSKGLMPFIYAIVFELILPSFKGVIFKVGFETCIWAVSRTSMYPCGRRPLVSEQQEHKGFYGFYSEFRQPESAETQIPAKTYNPTSRGGQI